MRIFIALEFSGEFLESLLNSVLSLKEKYPGVRWIPKENLHITMAFLGDTDPALLPRVFEAAGFASGFPAIHAKCGKIFTLPRSNPNVLAAGFDIGGDRMAVLAKTLGENLEKNGIIFDKKHGSFLPHITLARSKTGLKKENTPLIPAEGDIIRMTVFESRLAAQGAVYSALSSVPLKV